MLGFTLIMLMTDLQTSLIATPYMVYAPRLKGTRTGTVCRQHFDTSVGIFVPDDAYDLCRLCIRVRSRSSRAGTCSVGTGGWSALIMLREFVRRICFAGLKLKIVFLFDTSVAIAQISGLLVLAHSALLSASRAYWLVGSVCGIAVLSGYG